MKFTILSTLIAAASAMKTSHPSAKSLLSNARRVEQEDQEVDYTWIVDYSVVFDSCHVVDTYNFEEDEGGVVRNSLVKFKLCPSDNCMTSCSGAEYLVPMENFVNSFTEWQMNDIEYKCEQIRENCYCDGDDEDACEEQCYSDKGMYDSCVEAENDDDAYEFDLQEWLECRETDYEDYYGNKYYVGPKCSDNGERINLAVFTDEYCTQGYDDGIFMTTYGMSLPYSSSNIVAENCISCTAADANNNGYYNDAQITEICEESYVNAAKCETNLMNSLSYTDESGCDYLATVESLTRSAPSNAFAWTMVFIFGAACVGLLGVAGNMIAQSKRRNINLSDDSAVV